MTQTGSPQTGNRRTSVVAAPGGRYEVVSGPGVLDELGGRLADLVPNARRAFLAVDARLPSTLVERVRASIRGRGFEFAEHQLTATENEKSLTAVESLLGSMLSAGLERTEPVIALGGGIVGDIAGFAASIYKRGVPVVQCPTTLLAMVDAALGGKTGTNLRVDGRLQKNMAGTFHQPILVLGDVGALSSLEQIELVCGLAECVKHGLIGADFADDTLLDWTEQNASLLLARDPKALSSLVGRNVAVKANCVSRDEREQSDAVNGGRMALNLGHTIGHAIETIPGAACRGSTPGKGLRHGQAVALGLVAETIAGERLGVTPGGLSDRIRKLLTGLGLPIMATGLPPSETVLGLMADDKKALGGRLRVPFPLAGGRCRLVIDPDPAALVAGIESVRA